MKILLALALALPYLGFAQDPTPTAEAEVVQFDEGEDTATLDDSIYCSVAMVTRHGHIVRRYHGRRSLPGWRCHRPMRACRHDLPWGPHRRGLRCVELRRW